VTRRTPGPCACGATYAEFRLGMSFREARQMLWDQPDPSRPGWYRQKRRRSVLGMLRELKIQAWHMVHGGCEELLESREMAA